MKKLILILLIITSCTANKHKNKEKTDLSVKTEQNSSESKTVKQNSTQAQNISDSIVSNSLYNIDRSKTAVMQNFSLKNTGKCADPGSTRFVQFTDVLGNKTNIPVNDNTELNFGSESESKKEIESLKTENFNLKKDNTTLAKNYEAMSEKASEMSKKLLEQSLHNDTTTEKYTIWSFFWCIGIAIAVWELLKLLIKKYFFK